MIRLKNKCFKLASIAAACIMITACDREFDDPISDNSGYNNGTADFSNFVTVGDSLTAGYADAALYLHGQENSYPAMLAQQFARVGGGNFKQPLVSDNLGGLLFGGIENPEFGNRRVLNFETSTPETLAGTPTTEVTNVLTGAFNNIGVPGAKIFHLDLAGYGAPANLALGSANPYYVRFASSTTATMIDDAVAQSPSFFVLWAGNNDVLSYATAGGDGVDQATNFDPTTYGSDDITSPTVFAGAYGALLGKLTASNDAAKGLLVNIPDITTIPYFTTVPYNAVPLDQATADALNDGFAAYNGGVNVALGLSLINTEEAASRQITFAAGQNALLILDESLTDITAVSNGLTKMRQATSDDLIVLVASSIIGTLAADQTSILGISAPLEDKYVLTPEEQTAIETARTAFNVTIKAAADADEDILFYDVAKLMSDLQAEAGVAYETGSITSTYATGGAFSLDGVHPTARGYAVIANQMIDTINTGFNATIPTIDPQFKSTIFVK